MVPIFFSFLFTCNSCKRLEDELAPEQEQIGEYQFSNYSDEQEFKNTDEYNIPPSSIFLFDLYSTSDDGSFNRIKAAYIGNVNTINTDTIILLCQDGLHHMDYYFSRVECLYHAKDNLGILTFDYQGLGLSDGDYHLDNIIKDSKIALQWIQSQGVKKEQFMIYGHGLGSIAAYQLSNSSTDSLLEPNALILENPISSTEIVTSNSNQLNLPISYFQENNYDNIKFAKQTAQKTLFICATENEKYSFQNNGEILHDFHFSEKRMILIEKASHNNTIPKMGISNYQTTISNFILSFSQD